MLNSNRFQLPQGGFSLLEVIVALAILGIGLALITQLFAGGLRSVGVSEEYTRAILLARLKMEEVIHLSETVKSTESGEIEGTEFTWEAEVVPAELGERDDDRYEKVEAFYLTVRVKWPGIMGQRQVELNTLKTVPVETDLLPTG